VRLKWRLFRQSPTIDVNHAVPQKAGAAVPHCLSSGRCRGCFFFGHLKLDRIPGAPHTLCRTTYARGRHGQIPTYQCELARRLGVTELVVRRMLNPKHETKAARINEALAALGTRLVVSAA
jgi:hypothetical protein